MILSEVTSFEVGVLCVAFDEANVLDACSVVDVEGDGLMDVLPEIGMHDMQLIYIKWYDY